MFVIMGAGRPTKYNPDYCRQAVELISRHKFTQLELAAVWGVVESTIYEWSNKYPEFSESLQLGQDLKDCEDIERSAKQRAMGYEYVEEREDWEIDENGAERKVYKRRTRKHVPGDGKLVQFYLRSRNPERWPNLNKVEVKTDDNLSEILKEIGGKLPE